MRHFLALGFILTLLTPVHAAPAADSGVLVTVNGVPIKKTDAMDRTWKQYGTAVLNEMADEIMIGQAAKALKLEPSAKEVSLRLKRIEGQFADEATFKARLTASGTGLEELRARIEDQVLRENLVVKAKALKVTDAELKEFFEANKDKLASPESVHLRHLVVAAEKEANDFLTAIKAGADFGRLASQVSIDANTKDRGGDLGFLSRGMLQPEIEKLAFSLKAGEVSGPLKSQLGFHLIKVDEFKAPKAAVFNEIKDDLKNAILADKINKTWPTYLQEIREKAKIEAAKS